MSAVLAPQSTGYPDDVWDAVRAMWMAGSSANAIAKNEGMPSKQAICVRAKEDGWERVDKVDPALELIPFDGLSDKQRFAITKIAEGLPKHMAAALVGVHRTTLSDWISHDPTFATALQAAIAAKTYRRLKKVEQTEDWKASTWLLERDKDSREDFGAPKQAMPPMNFNVLGHVQVGLDRIEQHAEPSPIEIQPPIPAPSSGPEVG